ncbi:hypothetical protein E2L00_07900 [Cedecea colo]|uniref:Uncharacterized protein n=1 Tax=Cedecea colo TaxID=2552946 RepID=A0ABX0VKK1_9ENTR|nr:hypothetical protein [Cedecea colo]
MRIVSAVLTSAIFASATAVAFEQPINLPVPQPERRYFLTCLDYRMLTGTGLVHVIEPST